MKKIVPIILFSSLLLIGNITFVQGSALANLKGNITQTKAGYGTRLSEITPLQAKIRSNRSEITNLKLQAKTAYNKSKNNIKELDKSKDSLTPSQIAALKEGLTILQKDKQSIGSTIGELHQETLNFRAAKTAKNIDQVKDSLNDIIKVQNERITELQTIITDLTKISAI